MTTMQRAKPDRERPRPNREDSVAPTEPPVVALPEPGLELDQDQEWCVYRTSGGWQEVRFHDYSEVYDVPGLYEHLFYDILQCNSPATLRALLEEQLKSTGHSFEDLRLLDLGAGNGMVGEEFHRKGTRTIVGVDIIEAAKRALERDRPDIYNDYLVADMKKLNDEQRKRLESYKFNCLTCVAALGFGDIPPDAFTVAYNLLVPESWIAFNIKAEFLDGKDSSGFSRLIDRMIDDGTMEILLQKRYRHRIATNGDPLFYEAIIGCKKKDIA